MRALLERMAGTSSASDRVHGAIEQLADGMELAEGLSRLDAALAEAQEHGRRVAWSAQRARLYLEREIALKEAARKIEDHKNENEHDCCRTTVEHCADDIRALLDQSPPVPSAYRVPSINLLVGCMVENHVLRQIAEGIHRSLTEGNEDRPPAVEPPLDCGGGS